VINGYSELLLTSSDVLPQQADMLQEINVAGQRAGRLTNQLLTFSRKQPLRPRVLDLNEVIGDVAKMLRRLIGENIKLELNLSKALPALLADPGMLEQVLMNLAVNARDAMPKGGRLSITTEAQSIDQSQARERLGARAGEFICLTIQDTGCGMTPEILSRIFEPFFTTKEAGKGTGLGLATVFGIVKQQQGWIDVASAVNVGTTFKIFLPVTAEAAALSEASKPASATVGGNETILIVEDEEGVRCLATIVLERNGYRVLEAAAGPEALKVWDVRSQEIDLVLTDMIMPGGITGLDLAEKLQASKPSVKVIYTSGYSAELADEKLAAHRHIIFLQKPYDPRKLLEAIRTSLDKK
jgi:CheY-like chemotaxis protein